MLTLVIQLKRLALVCVALVTFCAVALTGISNFYQASEPQRALNLNPLNIDASVAILVGDLSRANLDDNKLNELAQVAQNAIRYTPIHARTRGLLGEVLVGRGDQETAEAVFNTALSLSQTETISLQRTLRTAAEQGDSAAAFDKLDILFRRYPRQFATFAPIIPFLLSLPDGYQVALSMLRQTPPWRPNFLNYLNGDPATVDLAYRLQFDLNNQAQQTNPQEIAGTVQALLRNKQYALAHRLFLLTLNETDRSHYGYLFNSDFELEPSGRPFDWTLRSQPGVRISRDTRETSNGNEATLTVQFLGKPVKRVGLHQHLFLPPGEYELAVDLDASNVKAPRGLYLQITCLYPRRIVSRLDIPIGTYRDRVLKTVFSLPDSSCEMLQLAMETDLIAESFRYRYSGTLAIRNISVRKTTS